MGTDLLIAIAHIVETNISIVSKRPQSLNRMNRQGEGLEAFVKDAFAETLSAVEESLRQQTYRELFSYHGNQNNPPDFMIAGGDAVEVKKVEGAAGGLQLNSSYPKAVLKSSSSMITNACRDAENWIEKDLLYVVGQLIQNNDIHSLWMVYGDCYAANEERYNETKEAVIRGVQQSGLQLESTNELGKIKRVDPLGITNLRVRGMWGIDSPWKVFHDFVPPNPNNEPRVIAIMSKGKFASMPAPSKARIKKLSASGLRIIEVQIPSPNDPTKLVEGVVIDWLRK